MKNILLLSALLLAGSTFKATSETVMQCEGKSFGQDHSTTRTYRLKHYLVGKVTVEVLGKDRNWFKMCLLPIDEQGNVNEGFIDNGVYFCDRTLFLEYSSELAKKMGPASVTVTNFLDFNELTYRELLQIGEGKTYELKFGCVLPE